MRKILPFLVCILSGCPSYELGFTRSLHTAVEREFHVDPENCDRTGNTTVCERPMQSDVVMINFLRDEAAISEAVVMLCSGPDCTTQYRMTCDLAGCVRHYAGDPEPTWTLR